MQLVQEKVSSKLLRGPRYSPRLNNLAEQNLIKHKPKVDRVLKKKIKKDYLMPISIVTAATILALAIFFQ